MKKRLKEMEDEAAALREMQAKVEKEMGSVQGLFLKLFCFARFVYIDFTGRGAGSLRLVFVFKVKK